MNSLAIACARRTAAAGTAAPAALRGEREQRRRRPRAEQGGRAGGVAARLGVREVQLDDLHAALHEQHLIGSGGGAGVRLRQRGALLGRRAGAGQCAGREAARAAGGAARGAQRRPEAGARLLPLEVLAVRHHDAGDAVEQDSPGAHGAGRQRGVQRGALVLRQRQAARVLQARQLGCGGGRE